MFKHEDSADESAVIEFDPIDDTEESTDDNTHESMHESTHENTHDRTHNGTRESMRENMHESVHESAYNSKPENIHESSHDSTRDMASRRKVSRPKVALAATITCPECGNGNRPQWLNKSQHGDSYATTMFCEQCGCLMTVWAMSVDAQVVARKQTG